ncbi:hypothetical protein D9M69_591000 [compost metagenome]
MAYQHLWRRHEPERLSTLPGGGRTGQLHQGRRPTPDRAIPYQPPDQRAGVGLRGRVVPAHRARCGADGSGAAHRDPRARLGARHRPTAGGHPRRCRCADGRSQARHPALGRTPADDPALPAPAGRVSEDQAQHPRGPGWRARRAARHRQCGHGRVVPLPEAGGPRRKAPGDGGHLPRVAPG